MDKQENPLIDLVANMTVAQLAEQTGISLVDLVLRVRGDGPKKTSAAPLRVVSKPRVESAPAAPARASRPKRVDTRTAAGREAYDEVVLAAIKSAGEPLGAIEIREKVGGTPAQARASLKRHIEEGAVDCEGNTRDTRYFIVK